MNAVEIEEAVSKLVEVAFDAVEFPYAFLEAFGNKPATIKRLRSTAKNTTNKSDVTEAGVVAVLQRNNIHIATLRPVAEVVKTFGPDAVADLFNQLLNSPATAKHKAKFAVATDGQTVHAASLNSDDPPLVCEFKDLDNHFGYFLELAGISTVRQIRENAFDIKATGRLNRLYVELLRNNPDWDGDQRREDLNHFFARLIFCFFAEDTGIFHGKDLFTDTIRQMSEPSGNNTHFVLSEIFRAMDVAPKNRSDADLRSWANQFPYVNGGLFGDTNSPEGDTRTAGGVSHRNAHTEAAKAQRGTRKFDDVSPSGLAGSGSRIPVADATGKDMPPSGLRSDVPKFTQIDNPNTAKIGTSLNGCMLSDWTVFWTTQNAWNCCNRWTKTDCWLMRRPLTPSDSPRAGKRGAWLKQS